MFNRNQDFYFGTQVHIEHLSDFSLQFLATVNIPNLNTGLDNSPLFINVESLVYRKASLYNQFTIIIKIKRKKKPHSFFLLAYLLLDHNFNRKLKIKTEKKYKVIYTLNMFLRKCWKNESGYDCLKFQGEKKKD